MDWSTFDGGAFIATVFTAGTFFLALLTYWARRPTTRLEYIVTTNTALLPREISKDHHVTHDGSDIEDPALSIVRIVNTGDRPIKRADFDTDLLLTFDGVETVVSATCTSRRPDDLQPRLVVDREVVRLQPILLNPGDMLQLHVLSAGQARSIRMEGRGTDLMLVLRESLPYEPGSGPEGEMRGIDRFMWFVVVPGIILFLGGAIAFQSDSDTLTQVVIGGSALILAAVVCPLYVKHLVHRRALWRP